jgi:hypothetical protein
MPPTFQRRPMKSLSRLLLAILYTLTLHAEPTSLLSDDFSQAQNPQRKAQRGEWKYTSGTATCTQDDELYKKFKNHGPILFYDLAYSDAVIEFAFQPDAAAKNLVFTANGKDGHIFRIIIGQANTSVRAFPAEEKDHKSIALATLPEIKLTPGQWLPVRVELRGSKAIVKLGFSFGTVSVKDLRVSK